MYTDVVPLTSARRCASIVAVLMALLSPQASGDAGAIMPVTMLTAQADAVLIARVVAGTISNRTCILTLDVEKTIKGTLSAGTTVTVEATVDDRAGLFKPVVYQERGIFFLRASASKKWTVLPLWSGRISSLRHNYFNLGPETRSKASAIPLVSPVEQVLGLVLGALADEGRKRPGSPVDLISEYRNLKERSAAVKLLFSDLGKSADPHHKRVSLAAGLVDGDEKALAQFQAQLPTMSTGDIRIAAQQLYSIETLTPDVRRVLGEFANSPAVLIYLREIAAAVLSRFHDARCVLFVAPLLESQEIQLAAMAVSALSQYANNETVGHKGIRPGPWKYRTDETIHYAAGSVVQLQNDPAILAFWKRWWADHRVEVAEAAIRP